MKYYVVSLYTKVPPIRQEEWLSAFIDVTDTGVTVRFPPPPVDMHGLKKTIVCGVMYTPVFVVFVH